MATQHGDLTSEAWSRFSRDQQILSIAAEMNRARKRILARDRAGLALAYERILNLVDLTVDVRAEAALRRELLLWRDLVAEMYVGEAAALEAHDAAFRALLSLVPAGYVQIAELLRPAGR